MGEFHVVQVKMMVVVMDIQGMTLDNAEVNAQATVSGKTTGNPVALKWSAADGNVYVGAVENNTEYNVSASAEGYESVIQSLAAERESYNTSITLPLAGS